MTNAMTPATAIFKYTPGRSPLVVSMPHVGTHIPPGIACRLSAPALRVPDTDWHLDRLYDFLGELDASVLQATHSRYVVDLNRPPDDASLYPGQDTTGLVPLDTAEKQSLYNGVPPSMAEIAERRATYWRPYHDRLAARLQEIKAQHGYALLWDAHSIKAELPRYFKGRLHDLNIGTADGASCGAGLGELLLDRARARARYSSILNGRFKGGYITRHYGQPADSLHAVQLELSWITYMNQSDPYEFREDLAQSIRPVLRGLMEAYLSWGAAHAGT